MAVTTIGSSAFAGCIMLTTAELSTALKKIGGSAFAKCASLREVILNTPAPPTITNSTFKGTSPTYLIPKGSLPIYVANKNWQKITGFKEK